MQRSSQRLRANKCLGRTLRYLVKSFWSDKRPETNAYSEMLSSVLGQFQTSARVPVMSASPRLADIVGPAAQGPLRAMSGSRATHLMIFSPRSGTDLAPPKLAADNSADLPGGLSGDIRVQPRLQKDFGFSEPQIRAICFAVPSHRGATRDRHGRGAGCGGRGCADDERRVIPPSLKLRRTGYQARRSLWRRRLRTAKSCGPDAPTLASSLRKATFAGDGGKKARSPGRARYKP